MPLEGLVFFFPFYKARVFIYLRVLLIHSDRGRQGAGGRYAACTWLFLALMRTLKHLGGGFSQFFHDKCTAVRFPILRALVLASALRIRHRWPP